MRFLVAGRDGGSITGGSLHISNEEGDSEKREGIRTLRALTGGLDEEEVRAAGARRTVIYTGWATDVRGQAIAVGELHTGDASVR